MRVLRLLRRCKVIRLAWHWRLLTHFHLILILNLGRGSHINPKSKIIVVCVCIHLMLLCLNSRLLLLMHLALNRANYHMLIANEVHRGGCALDRVWTKFRGCQEQCRWETIQLAVLMLNEIWAELLLWYSFLLLRIIWWLCSICCRPRHRCPSLVVL